ncbi:MAG: Gar1/Naf1 family protein [Nitrososphaeria archaeon]|nr:Gar1/Naf1 family protein [Nitrososphaeria archaeon]
MKKLGIVLHKAKSGNLVLKATEFFKSSLTVYDDEGKKVGFVVETFGPVNSPYVLVKPTTDRIHKLLGKTLYVKDDGEGIGRKRA